MPVQPRAVINDYGTFSDFHSVYGSLTHSLRWHGPSGWAGSSAVGPISWGELVFVWGGTLRGGGEGGGSVSILRGIFAKADKVFILGED